MAYFLIDLYLFILFIIIYLLFFYIFSPTAIGKLAHPDGELALARAAHSRKIIQIIPNMASYSLEVFI
jgi:FMN-dependent dehydrogenase